MKNNLYIIAIISAIVLCSVAMSTQALTQTQEELLQGQIASLSSQIADLVSKLFSQTAAITSCTSNYQCGTNGWIGEPMCLNGDVYQTYKTNTCLPTKVCRSSAENRLKEDCLTVLCVDGSCCKPSWTCGGWNNICIDGNYRRNCTDTNNCGVTTGKPATTIACSEMAGITCLSNFQCGTDVWTGNSYCGTNTSVYQLYTTYTCSNPGTQSSHCSSASEGRLKEDCVSKNVPTEFVVFQIGHVLSGVLVLEIIKQKLVQIQIIVE